MILGKFKNFLEYDLKMKIKKILCIIPARRIKRSERKNIQKVDGKPLIFIQLNQQLKAKFVIFLFQQMMKIAQEAIKFGAEVPF